jgi:hypothetical protein
VPLATEVHGTRRPPAVVAQGIASRGESPMLRGTAVIVIVWAGLAWTATAGAQGAPDLIHHIYNDFCRHNAWPYPYSCPAQQAVRAPFMQMVEAGWQRQNLLGDHHFNELNQLNEAGRLKVRWILNEVPAQHRSIFVHQDDSSEGTAARMLAVNDYVSGMAAGAAQVPITETGIYPVAWPATRIDSISQKFESSAPAPRLPQSSSGSSSGGQK